ncbi:MAG: TonB-dependent receptor [Steroidobacteraceae bacterium]
MRTFERRSKRVMLFSKLGMGAAPSLTAAVALAAALNASAAHAQAADTSAQPQQPPTLNEIIVTATKRSQTVQATPLSITAYSGADLAAAGVTSIADVGYETPGVSERNSGPGQTEFEMRGIASSGGQSPTVGFYLDDTPLTPPSDAQLGKVVVDPDLYDLQRVEILRGPQGTLYGAGSMGGTIKLITNPPDPSAFSSSVNMKVSNTEGGGLNYGGNAMLNIPLITDRVAVRLVGTDEYVDGWINRIVLSPFPLETNGGMTRGNVTGAPVLDDYKDVNNERIQGMRATLLVKATDTLTIKPSVFYQKITQGGLSYADNPPGTSYEAHYEPYNVPEPYSDEFTLYSLLIKNQFNGFDLTSATSEYIRHTSMNEDSTEATQDFFETVIGIPDLPYSQVGSFVTTATDASKQFSEELRLTSNTSGPLQWILGGFYQDFNSTDDVFTNTPGPIAVEVLGVPSLYNVGNATNYKQEAAFGEASYKLPENLQLTAGLRYYSYHTGEELAESGGLPNGSLIPTVFNLPASNSGESPKVNLSYLPSDNLTLYVQAVKGFRPGGGNTPPPYACPSNPLQYGPDSLWSYEGGEKARLFDDRVVANSAAYYERWSGIQQSVAETCGASYTANAGTADVYGGEFELMTRITDHLTLTNSAGFTHARIVQSVPGGTFYVGEQVQDVPTWTDSTSLELTHPVANGYELVARASNVFVGSMTDVSYAINEVPSHDIVNLRLGLNLERADIDLFLDNAANTHAILGNTNALSFNVATFNRVATNQPRTVGLDINYYFGGK